MAYLPAGSFPFSPVYACRPRIVTCPPRPQVEIRSQNSELRTQKSVRSGRCLSRDDRAVAVDRLVLADHQRGGVVLLLADILEKLRAVLPAQAEAALPGRRVRARVVDGELVVDRREIGSREALEGTQF